MAIFRAEPDIASSCVALLWFDFTLTLTTEYERIWRRKLTGATIVYLGVRHVGVVERIFFVLEILVWKTSNRVRSSPIHHHRTQECLGTTPDTVVRRAYLATSVILKDLYQLKR